MHQSCTTIITDPRSQPPRDASQGNQGKQVASPQQNITRTDKALFEACWMFK